MKPNLCAVLIAGLCTFFVPAHAQSSYSSGFTVVEWLPVPVDRTAPARWTDNVAFRSVTIRTRDQVGSEIDPATGDPSPVWGRWFGSSDNEHVSVTQGHGVETVGDVQIAYPFARSMSGHIDVAATGGEAHAHALWDRGFELDAGASFTFSGIASLGVSGNADALDLVSTAIVSDPLSFAMLSLADRDGRVGFTLAASLDFAGVPGSPDTFSYHFGPDGLVSLMITNHTQRTVHGTLRAASTIDVAVVAVPEPQTYALWLAGIAVLGLQGRRRAAAGAGVSVRA